MAQLTDFAVVTPFRQLVDQDLALVFAPDDILRLRHLPDIYVRPGGTPWETSGIVEDREETGESPSHFSIRRIRPNPEGPFDLVVKPVEEAVAIGAPLRIDFALHNRSATAKRVPARISLKTPFVRGWVIDAAGEENEFRSIFKMVASDGLGLLSAGGAMEEGLTLLRGQRGALASKPGRYTLWLEIEWQDRDRVYRARARQKFTVTPARSTSHARAARRLNRTPESLWYLAVGRSYHFRAGERAVDEALGTEELHAHYAYIKAKALAVSYGEAMPGSDAVRKLLSKPEHIALLNRDEKRNVVRMLRT